MTTVMATLDADASEGDTEFAQLHAISMRTSAGMVLTEHPRSTDEYFSTHPRRNACLLSTAYAGTLDQDGYSSTIEFSVKKTDFPACSAGKNGGVRLIVRNGTDKTVNNDRQPLDVHLDFYPTDKSFSLIMPLLTADEESQALDVGHSIVFDADLVALENAASHEWGNRDFYRLGITVRTKDWTTADLSLMEGDVLGQLSASTRDATAGTTGTIDVALVPFCEASL